MQRVKNLRHFLTQNERSHNGNSRLHSFSRMEAKYTMKTEMLAIYKIVTYSIYEGSYFTTGIIGSVKRNNPREDDIGVEMSNHSADLRETHFLWLVRRRQMCFTSFK